MDKEEKGKTYTDFRLLLWISFDPDTTQPQITTFQNLSACNFYSAGEAANKHETPTGIREMLKGVATARKYSGCAKTQSQTNHSVKWHVVLFNWSLNIKAYWEVPTSACLSVSNHSSYVQLCSQMALPKENSEEVQQVNRREENTVCMSLSLCGGSRWPPLQTKQAKNK